jgi:hypothetical protein
MVMNVMVWKCTVMSNSFNTKPVFHHNKMVYYYYYSSSSSSSSGSGSGSNGSSSSSFCCCWFCCRCVLVVYVCNSYQQYDNWLSCDSHKNICAQVQLVSPLAKLHFINALQMYMIEIRYNNMRSIGVEVCISVQNLRLPLNPFWHMHFLQKASSVEINWPSLYVLPPYWHS